jgi:hypothetical protein
MVVCKEEKAEREHKLYILSFTSVFSYLTSYNLLLEHFMRTTNYLIFIH